MEDCSNLMALDDEELLRYIFNEGTFSEDRKQHLEQCPICQERLAEYKQTNTILLSGLYRAQCPSATQITLYCANELSADEVFSIDEHLRECLLCSDEANLLRREIGNFNPFPSDTQSFPQAALQALKRLVAQRIVQLPDMVVRQNASPSPWPWEYQAEGYHLSFQLSRTNTNQEKLIGFFVSSPLAQLKDLEGVVVDLYQLPIAPASGSVEEPILSTEVDDMGNFAFSPISAGEYTVIMHLPGTELVIEGLNIT